MTDQNNIPRIPSISDREHTRIDEQIYLYCEPLELDNGNKHDSQGLTIPTFVQEEDDIVGLSIDAFREQVNHENPPNKDYYLRMQQLLSMMKRFFDSEVLGRKQKMYKKVLVNISGSGMAYPSDVAYHAGQFLKLSLYFPKYPFSFLSIAAEVVRSEKAEIGYEIKVKFKDISEKSCQEILRFVEESQKKNI